MPSSFPQKPVLYVLAPVTLLVFLADRLLPLGVAAGVPYIVPVLLAAVMTNRRTTYFTAGVCTLLVLFGLVLSPEGGELWKVAMNRGLAVAAIWFVAWGVLWQRAVHPMFETQTIYEDPSKQRYWRDFEYLLPADNDELTNDGLTLEEFVQRVDQSGVLGRHDVERFVADLPDDKRPTTVDELVKQLVRGELLTRYQAALILGGKTEGLLFGDYVIEDLLGRGGMSVVLKARQRGTGKVVALKLLAPSAMRKPQNIERFKREIEAATELDHPNIVKAVGSGLDDDTMYLMLEYIDGLDLHALVARQGRLDPATAADYLLQAALGLQHAHQHNLIHRDVKPSNLMVDKQGKVKLLDLGLVRLKYPDADIHGEPTAVTEHGTLIGSLDFMAPEQALDLASADQRSDIFGLGSTLYFLLTGKSIWRGSSSGEKLQDILADPTRQMPSLDRERPDTPDSLARIYHRLVERDPAKRPASVDLVVSELQDCLAGLSAGAGA